ncbi:hypothetical protein NMY22_g10593 [Coprinellus aureogranulatus]|nr:hypothetical protein NMY22_g10593 [Coprinellus aureogranulatus]
MSSDIPLPHPQSRPSPCLFPAEAPLAVARMALPIARPIPPSLPSTTSKTGSEKPRSTTDYRRFSIPHTGETMIVGADVSYPSPGIRKPSVASLNTTSSRSSILRSRGHSRARERNASGIGANLLCKGAQAYRRPHTVARTRLNLSHKRYAWIRVRRTKMRDEGFGQDQPSFEAGARSAEAAGKICRLRPGLKNALSRNPWEALTQIIQAILEQPELKATPNVGRTLYHFPFRKLHHNWSSFPAKRVSPPFGASTMESIRVAKLQAANSQRTPAPSAAPNPVQHKPSKGTVSQTSAVLGKEVLTAYANDRQNMVLSPWISAPPVRAGHTSHGKLSADQWRVLCTVNLPVTLIRLWGRQPRTRWYQMLENFLELVVAVEIASMVVVSEELIVEYEKRMQGYLNGLLVLYPDAPVVPNHHISPHW